MMTVAISNGLIILLLFSQNIYAQQAVNNVVNNAGLSQPSTGGVNFNSPQPGQQINWQQPSNMQQVLIPQQPQNFQQPGINSQVKQLNQNPLSDIFSALHSLRFSAQKPQGANPLQANSCGYTQNYEQTSTQAQNSGLTNNQYVNQASELSKPTFTFQFVPVSPQNMVPENQQVMNTVPVQYLSSGQSQGQEISQQGPNYYVQSSPTNQQAPTTQNTNSGQSQPIVFTMNPLQPTSGQSQSIVYTLQPVQSSARTSQNNQPKQPQTAQAPNKFDNPMAMLMSQLQSPSGNPDISSLLPMLMNSKQEKSGGMKALLPLILNLLNDRGCGCPHCGCPYNNPEPTINGGYSNQKNYSQRVFPDEAKMPEITKSVPKNNKESTEVDRPTKKYKTNVINDISDEASDEDYEDYEDDDD